MAGLGNNVGTQFNLRARMNGFFQAAGQNLTAWFFSDGSGMMGSGFMGNRTVPSAHIEPIEGQLIKVDFFNMSMMDHTIHLHGLDVDQQNDGVPQTSFAIPHMGSYTYEFIAPHAGTYHYHCHVDTVIHYARGMIGGVIVRPPDGSTNKAWNGGPTFQEEVLWHLHTVDTTWFTETQSGPKTARHRPNAFMINGKETAAALVDPYTKVSFGLGQKAYIRILNVGYQWARVRLGGLLFDVVASDGRPMKQVVTTDVWELGPGERYDLLLSSTQPAAVDATVDYLDDYSGDVLGTAKTRILVS